MFTETWLNESIFDREILPVGYDIFRRDRVSGTGRSVLIAAKSRLGIQRVQELESDDLEIVAVSGATTNGKAILMAVCYRPPSSNSSWIQSFENFVDKIYSNYNFEAILITGDFNYPSIRWNFDSHSNANDAQPPMQTWATRTYLNLQWTIIFSRKLTLTTLEATIF